MFSKQPVRRWNTVTRHIRPRLRVLIGHNQGVCSHAQGIKATKTRTKGTRNVLMYSYQVADWLNSCFLDGYAKEQGIFALSVGRDRTL